MSDDEQPDNVVRIEFGAGAPQTKIEGSLAHNCEHGSVLIDRKDRKVQCRHCSATVDPFEYIMSYAEKERRFRDWDSEARRVRDGLSKLREEESDLKRRVQALKRTEARGSVAAERARIEARFRGAAEKALEIGKLARQIERALANGGLEVDASADVLDERERCASLVNDCVSDLYGTHGNGRENVLARVRRLSEAIAGKRTRRKVIVP